MPLCNQEFKQPQVYHYLITWWICQSGKLVFQFQSGFFTGISLSISQTSRLCNRLGMKLLVPGGCVSQNPVGRFCNRLVEAIYWRTSCLSDCHRQISVTGDPVVLTGLVDLSCLLPMGTTDFSVTGEPAVSTGMVGAADLSVTTKLCNQWACCQHWDGGSSRSHCNG